MQNDLLKTNCYEKIINNYIELCYLNVLSLTKNPEITFEIIVKSVERVLVFDSQIDNLMNIKEKMQKYALQQIKNYVSVHYEEINKTDLSLIDCSIPEKLYLFNFDAHKIFNDVDIKILIGLVILKYDVKDLSLLIRFSPEYIMNRYRLILRHIRSVYLNIIRENFSIN